MNDTPTRNVRAAKRRLLKAAHAEMDRVMLGSVPGTGLVFVQIQGITDHSPPKAIWHDGERLPWRVRWMVLRRVLRMIFRRG